MTWWSYAQLHTNKDIQPPLKLQQILQFVLASRHFFPPSSAFLVLLEDEKKRVGRKWHFWFPQYEHSAALSQHLLTPSVSGLLSSAGIPSANMGSITLRCHNLIVFSDLCSKFWLCVTIITNVAENYPTTIKKKSANGLQILSGIKNIFMAKKTPNAFVLFLICFISSFHLKKIFHII